MLESMAQQDSSVRLDTTRAALVGVLALAASLATGQLVGAFVSPAASPYVAVGDSVIDLAPAWLVEFGKDTFGTANKTVLLLGMAVVLVVVAVLAGLGSRSRPHPGVVVVAVFGLIGAVAVTTRPELGIAAALAPVAAGVVGAGVFVLLHRYAAQGPVAASGSDRRDRRTAAPAPDAAPAAGEALTADATGDADTAAVDDTADAHLADLTAAGADGPGRPLAGRDATGGGDTSRRRFLVGSLVVATGAGAAGAVGQWLTGPDIGSSRRAVGSLTPVARTPAIPPGADFVADGTPAIITEASDFYTIHTALVVPTVRAEDWRLRIHGMVRRPLTLDYAQLRARPLVERTITMACVSNPVGGDLVSTATFVGVDLAELLSDVGIDDGAEQLLSTSEDGFTAGTPVDVVRDRDRGAMLALGMNGEPLPLEHGFPVRMVVPGLYGFVSATKWLVDLEVTTWRAKAPYWLQRGWAREAPVKTQSRIDAPSGGATVDAGTAVVAGTAWAPHTGIRAVEVRVGDGPWQRAELAAEVNVDTWRMWRAEVDLPPGEHRLTCRATDAGGTTQPAQQSDVLPDGATGWHQIDVTAR